MIEVRTYGGDPREAAAFTTYIWRQSYGGHHPIPLWDEPYYAWQLFGRDDSDRSLAVAAYDSGVLVGTFFAEPFPFRFQGQDREGSMSSWLTVDPRARGKGVGRKMADELRKRHRERNLAFSIGFAVAGTNGPSFWGAMPDTIVFGKMGFWARVLDRAAVGAWLASGWERVVISLLGPVLSPLRETSEAPGVRTFRADDLERCLALTLPLTEASDVGYRWTPDRLRHQLDYPGVPRTLVLERGGIVQGFINSYAMDFLLRTSLRVAQVDLLATGSLDGDERHALIGAALGRMRDEGAALVLVPRVVGCPTSALLRHRFVPLPADMAVTCVFPDTSIPRRRFGRFHLTVR